MRFPPEGVHYLVDAYINKFKLETIPFYNIDPQKNCFVSVEGETARVYDFISDNQTDRAIAKAMCDKLWPGWDRRIIKNGLRTKYRIDHVGGPLRLTVHAQEAVSAVNHSLLSFGLIATISAIKQVIQGRER
ncbi:Hypothetical predicted protein [Paramuricea clavata]|uniref:Uncharacterized protein n=1 Tax=Paramuricea clavata TaxID=317549 RepID=A0A6S7FYD3_PARCT|nr:Hypothetical predicted protein [Paramuricea clavata]